MSWPWWFLAVLGVGLSGFVSGCEMGLYCLNPIRLELARRRGRWAATTLTRMLADRAGLITALLVGNNAADYMAAACVVSLFIGTGMGEQEAELYTALLLTPLIFVFGEVLPKNLVRQDADRFMNRAAAVLHAMNLGLRATGVVAMLKALARLAARLAGLDPHTPLSSLEPRQQILAVLREGVGAGVLSDQQSLIAERVLNLSRVPVRSAMIDRSRTVSVSIHATRDEFTELAASHRYSRMPVLERPHQVVGVVNVFDVLADDRNRPIRDFVQPALELLPDQSVTSALTTMQRRGIALAVVTNRQGHFLGIVTLKDLVEEIVGELHAW